LVDGPGKRRFLFTLLEDRGASHGVKCWRSIHSAGGQDHGGELAEATGSDLLQYLAA
jgi:hypothetical protein